MYTKYKYQQKSTMMQRENVLSLLFHSPFFNEYDNNLNNFHLRNVLNSFYKCIASHMYDYEMMFSKKISFMPFPGFLIVPFYRLE